MRSKATGCGSISTVVSGTVFLYIGSVIIMIIIIIIIIITIIITIKVKKETMIIDKAILGDTRVCDKERKDQEIQLVKRQNCHIMVVEKGCCDSNCSWSIRNYNKKV